MATGKQLLEGGKLAIESPTDYAIGRGGIQLKQKRRSSAMGGPSQNFMPSGRNCKSFRCQQGRRWEGKGLTPGDRPLESHEHFIGVKGPRWSISKRVGKWSACYKVEMKSHGKGAAWGGTDGFRTRGA